MIFSRHVGAFVSKQQKNLSFDIFFQKSARQDIWKSLIYAPATTQ